MAPGTRVALKRGCGCVEPLSGAIGIVRDTTHTHSDGKQWMEFETPIRHYTHGQMTGCWFGRSQVTILGHEADAS